MSAPNGRSVKPIEARIHQEKPMTANAGPADERAEAVGGHERVPRVVAEAAGRPPG